MPGCEHCARTVRENSSSSGGTVADKTVSYAGCVRAVWQTSCNFFFKKNNTQSTHLCNFGNYTNVYKDLLASWSPGSCSNQNRSTSILRIATSIRIILYIQTTPFHLSVRLHFMHLCDLTCKHGSVGQSEGLLFPRSSVRFRLKPKNSDSNGFELHRPSNKGTKLWLKVIKVTIIIIIIRL